MHKKFSFVIAMGAISALAITGCSSAPKVERIKVEKKVDLSGRWNDTDSRTVSEEMIKNCLAQPWLDEFHKASGRNPVVIVGPINNLSDEHINVNLFVKDLEANLINSNKATFVASNTERASVRGERQDQQAGLTDPATVKPMGQETGADFMLQGSVNTVRDEIKGKYVILYQVNLELIDLTTNQKKWVLQTEFKKLVSRSQYSL